MILEQLVDERILSAWEAGMDAPASLRAARLLAALERHDALDSHLDTPLGTIDRSLLHFYANEFAPDIEGSFACGACGEGLEVHMAVDQLLSAGDPAEPGEIEGYGGCWRYPTPRALQAAERSPDQAESLAQFALFGAPPDSADPDSIRQVVADAMELADPLLDVTIETECAHCGNFVRARLDVASFVLSAVTGRARGILNEVDRLARAYGWTQAEVLGLPERRRRAYLSIVGAGADHA